MVRSCSRDVFGFIIAFRFPILFRDTECESTYVRTKREESEAGHSVTSSHSCLSVCVFYPLHMCRGMFIVIEGLDRVGKTTQCRLLQEYVQSTFGRPIQLLRFPNRCSIVGKRLDLFLKGQVRMSDETAHLLFSEDRWLSKSHIVNALNGNISILSDRYLFSGIAYSRAKGLEDACWRSTELGLPSPDLVIFLDSAPESLLERAEYGNELHEAAEFQRNVRAHYFKLCDSTWKIVNACKSIPEVHLEIQQIVRNFRLDFDDSSLLQFFQ